uniref:MRH domain-containing protein n=1 Tax=Periophthalmus magnuspinnatus TaxID=409849 RepID=A0A3B3ZPQ4_9GOBI
MYCWGKLGLIQNWPKISNTKQDTGVRWRVAIPQSPGSCSGLPNPVKGTECTFSCQAGQFLEMSAQECTPCAAGSFSLGSGVRFDQWDSLPAGFSSVASSGDSSTHVADNLSCNSSAWLPQGTYLESSRDECTVSLIYAVHLKKQGSVSFEYQYPDRNLLFQFFIQNDQCQEMDQTADTKWLKLTSHGEWASHTVNLKSGTNILYWRTGGVVMGSKVVKPVFLKNIQIEGVAYTSECFPCKPGTFSRVPGSSACEACPRDTFSGHGASSCTPCNTTTHYAAEGSSKCKTRLPCSKKDYFQLHTACDHEGKTQVVYKWMEPKICLDDVPGAVSLPPGGEREPCPPCNPGFYNNDTATCSPCPSGTYSDGMKPCAKCPAGTEPTPGYEFKWWNVLPPNMKSTCFNVGNSKCDLMNGWETAGEYVQSGAGASDNDYLLLNIRIPGFKLPTSMSGQSSSEYGRITFEFETQCTADCELYFMMDINRKSTTVVESWSKTQNRRTYSHVMNQNASVSYTWAFQRTNQPSEVTPTCSPTPPPGQTPASLVDQGLKDLGPVGVLMNGPSFTSKGTKYYHLFNISLCGGQLAECKDNVTDLSLYESQGGKPEGSTSVKAFICQSTIIPASGRGFHTSLSSQSITLADAFIGATVERTLGDITARPDLFPEASNKVPDVNFYYRSSEATSSCAAGRRVVVQLRCNPNKSAKGEISVPSLCPAGTCDGCTFNFLWQSSSACPVCSANDYHQIEGACKGGQQEVVSVWSEPRVCVGGVGLPQKRTIPCESVEMWVQLGGGLGALTALLLVSLTCYFWKKNKRLEYKYSRLVMSANKECELPGADSCAMMEGDTEGEMEDEVLYSKPSLIGKLKALASKVLCLCWVEN